MKKAIRLISILLVIAVVSALAISLVACNKDKIETTTVSSDEVDELLTTIKNNTKQSDNFRYQYKCDDIESDIYVMKVEYSPSDVGMALGTDTEPDGDKIIKKTLFFGDYLVVEEDGRERFANKKGYYEFENNAWVLKNDYEVSNLSDLGVFGAFDTCLDSYLLREPPYEMAVNYVTKTTKNGTLQYYEGKITATDKLSFTFKTVNYNGNQVLESLVLTSTVDRTEPLVATWTYTYGTTFEIPVVELDK